jgi:hypothetical protein
MFSRVMQADLEKGGRPVVKIPAVFAIDRGGGRARHKQKAIFHARETDITEHVIVEFERHAAFAKAHPQIAHHVEEPADEPGAAVS